MMTIFAGDEIDYTATNDFNKLITDKEIKDGDRDVTDFDTLRGDESYKIILDFAEEDRDNGLQFANGTDTYRLPDGVRPDKDLTGSAYITVDREKCILLFVCM